MDRATLERNLAQVERDLRAASDDIAQQHETLKELVRHGEDTTEALRSIGIVEHTHLMFCSLRDQLDEELAALD
jgi:DNA-directed RNA polymerase subunit N (RpoN/RPB10)